MNKTALAFGLIALVSACSTPTEEPDAAERVAPELPPWTEEFQEQAMLVAAEVHIEGPPGLREHLAIAQDAKHYSYTIETVPQGLRQVTEVLPASVGEVPVRCLLDNLTLLVERRIVVLERPGHVPVTITAHGDVFWRNSVTGAESRAKSFILVGESPR